MSSLDSKMCRRWCLTINNESRSDEELSQYIQGLEHFKYCIFQREQGHEKGTQHIQMFIIFSIGKRFGTVKNYFPTAHIEDAKGTNTQCRDYCSKSDTKIGDTVELGQFAEERSRTDISNFIELVQSGASSSELISLYPHLYLKELNKISSIYQQALYDKFKTVKREVEVTYIYGSPGSGKTSYIVNKHGLGTYYDVANYNNSAFDMYNAEDIIVFDEFTGQIPITQMNKYLDYYPLQLPARFSNKVACYTKVYIVSNLPLSKLYEFEQNNNPTLYQAFIRRIHKVINIEKSGIYELPVGVTEKIESIF